MRGADLFGSAPRTVAIRLSLSLSPKFLALVGGHGDNLGAQFLTVRSGVGNLVTLLSAHNCCAQRRLLGEDLQIATCREGVLNFAGAEQELQGAACNLSLDDHAVAYHAVINGCLTNLGGFEQVLELLDARLVLSLLVTGSVVAAVLAEVTLIACLRDAVNNFLAVRAGEVLPRAPEDFRLLRRSYLPL